MPITAGMYFHEYAVDYRPGAAPVILIHGAGGDHLYWPPQIRRLPGRRVFAIDLPGHGKSQGHGLQSASGYAEAVLEWMTAEGLASAALVGHSMGGAIVLEMALQDPERVTALGLISTGARLRVAPALLEQTAQANSFQIAVSMIIDRSFVPGAPENLIDLARRRMSAQRHSVLHGDFLACDSFDVSDILARIQQPSLILVGDQDEMTPRRLAERLAGGLPRARLEVIPAAGHMLMLEQPEAVAQAILAFLDRAHP